MAAILKTMREGAGTQHEEEIVNFIASRLVGISGVFDLAGGDFLVEESDTPAMTVDVGQGFAFVRKSNGQMAYPVWLDNEDAQVAITSNSSGNSRVDAIVLYIDLGASANAAISNVAKLVAVAGTPAGSPVAPDDTAIQAAIGASNPYLVLGYVTVEDSETTILDADIEDRRVPFGITVPGSRKSPIYNNGNSGAAATIDWSKGDTQKITLTDNCTLSFENVVEGQYLTLYIIQDAGGGNSLTFPAGSAASEAEAPDLVTTGDAVNAVGIRAFSASVFHILAVTPDIQDLP